MTVRLRVWKRGCPRIPREQGCGLSLAQIRHYCTRLTSGASLCLHQQLPRRGAGTSGKQIRVRKNLAPDIVGDPGYHDEESIRAPLFEWLGYSLKYGSKVRPTARSS